MVHLQVNVRICNVGKKPFIRNRKKKTFDIKTVGWKGRKVAKLRRNTMRKTLKKNMKQAQKGTKSKAKKALKPKGKKAV